METLQRCHFILYVSDQARSTRFYEAVFATPPTLQVPGMTEFELADNVVVGLMPIEAIRRLLRNLPDPGTAADTPRSELYLLVENPEIQHGRARDAGATELSPVLPRDWGHRVGYSLDPDAHVLAFAALEPQQSV